MITHAAQDEQSLQNHIQNLLFQYVKANVTVDYVEWTERAVAELLQDCLREIPTVDPTSLWIPTEPFDVLKQLYRLSELSAYEEKLQTSPHALDSVRKSVVVGVLGGVRSDKAACVDDKPSERETMDEPILTMRAIRNTPKFPSGSLSAIQQKGPFHVSEGIRPVENDDPEDAPLHDTLNVNWQISTSESQAVHALLKAKLYFSGRVPSYSKAQIDSSDECDTRPSSIYRPDSPFIPLFPRKPRNKNASSKVGNRLNSFVELPAYLSPQIPTEELEKELFNNNMRVIDDWGAHRISSPSTVSTPTSSQEDRKISSLFRGSSPITDPIEELEAAKMDIVHIPRSRRPGAGIKSKSVAEGDSFSSFILETLHGSKEQVACGSGGRDCLGEFGSSLVGEASCSATKASFAAVGEADMNDDIRALCVNESYQDFWSTETLDEKNMMLMEVPTLPSPNIHHPTNLFLPSKFNDFYLASKDQDNDAILHKFLKKVKGLQPLNVALSWKAFSTNSPLPSNAQLAEVSSCFEEYHYGESGVSVQAMRRLIDSSKPDVGVGQMDRAVVLGTSRLLGDRHEKDASLLSAYGPEMVLTRRERSRVAGCEMFQQLGEEAGDREDVPVGNQTEQKEVTRSDDRQNFRQVSQVVTNIYHISEKPELTLGFPNNEFPTTPKEADESIQRPSLANTEATFRNFLLEKFGKDINGPEPYDQPPGSTTLWHETNIVAFAKLRSRTLSLPEAASNYSVENIVAQSEPNTSCNRNRTIPSDIFTRTTLRIPHKMKRPNAVHYYMASLDLLQKQMLVRALRQPECSVAFIERDCLGGADVIIDPFTAILYRSLFSLSSECEELINHIARVSWAFQKLVVVLEAYPPAYAVKVSDQAIEPLYAFTPPILKAIKRLRRGVDMAEADQEKRSSTVVLYSFPNTVQEAALVTRYIGDMAEEADETDGVLWSDRSWLESVDKDEKSLSNGAGMNRFISAIILNQVTLDEFIAMSGEERHHAFSTYVGADAIALFNADMQERLSTMQSSDNTSPNVAAMEWYTNEHHVLY